MQAASVALRRRPAERACDNGPIVTLPSIRWRTAGAWALLCLAGILWLARQDYVAQRDRFAQGASIAHRLLSQKAVQHEAVLATLAALSHPPAPDRLLPSLQPALAELLALGWLSPQGWQGSEPEPEGLRQALAQARTRGHAVTLPIDAAQYWLVAPSSWSMRIDARRLLPTADVAPALGRLTLDVHEPDLVLYTAPGAPSSIGPLLQVSKPLGSASQPFLMQAQRRLAPADWPWFEWAVWLGASGLIVAAARYWQHSRRQARRQAEQARMAALARLNTLGEMAAGIAHELNQPLTAILAQNRAAERLLDDPDELPAVRQALRASAQQARRAADIIERLRAMVGPGNAATRVPLAPDALVASLCFLSEPELARHEVALNWTNDSPAARPLGDPVAVEQILHNLVNNALTALAAVPGPRRIRVRGHSENGYYHFSVSDNGPGIAPEHLPHLFEPFYTTRDSGMGLGLTLCDTLAGSMDGRMQARNLPEGGACFTLSLPLERAA
ncbi:sensor histidine kinase [Bordetella genomosp. 5]|uniref:histidine kinase n=1 Tax=Bordetella genomosp. 5 TaxID=1395608 RepID=A0A261T8T0_9BORD|nr:sensor histidine kinase [Bordetella genomosp. 5]